MRVVIGHAASQGDVNDWLVTFCYFFGDTLWQVAVIFQMVEALNPGYDARIFEWQQAGCKGPKPRYWKTFVVFPFHSQTGYGT